MNDGTEKPAHLLPYGASRLAPRIDLVDVAAEIARADEAIARVTHAELALIAEQMAALRARAERILEEARASVDLHRARCSFVRRPGHTYHLYRRPPDELYFSMLGPDDWSGKPPHAHLGRYRLEADLRWTKLEEPGG